MLTIPIPSQIVPSDLAQLGPRSVPLRLDANHEDIGRLSEEGYRLLKSKLDGVIAAISQEGMNWDIDVVKGVARGSFQSGHDPLSATHTDQVIESISSSPPMSPPSTSTPPDGHSEPQPATNRSIVVSSTVTAPVAPLLPPRMCLLLYTVLSVNSPILTASVAETALNAEPIWGSSDVSVKSQCRVLWLHQPNEHFVGRETTLAKMKEHLGGNGTPPAFNSQRAYSLWGKGGVGKTQVAVKYVYDNSEVFPYILWARADTREKLLTSFSDYALRLGLIAKQSQDPAEGKDALLHWYATTSKYQPVPAFLGSFRR